MKTLYKKVYPKNGNKQSSFQICFADKRRRKRTSYAISKPLRSTDIISIAQPFSDAIKVFFSYPDVEWKKRSLLLHAIYLSVISLLVALNILLVVRRWRKPVPNVKGN